MCIRDRAYTTIIYSQQINDQGQPEWVEYQRLQSPEENRIWKPLNEISPYIQHAFVAVEDENFYTHPGFSFKRTVLAAINEVFRKLTGSYLTGSQPVSYTHLARTGRRRTAQAAKTA